MRSDERVPQSFDLPLVARNGPLSEIALVVFDLAAQRTVQFALAGEAAMNDLVDALGPVVVDTHYFRGTTHEHFQGEVADQLVD